jgi:hypothetical protein
MDWNTFWTALFGITAIVSFWAGTYFLVEEHGYGYASIWFVVMTITGSIALGLL